jgi:hypothetical protein
VICASAIAVLLANAKPTNRKHEASLRNLGIIINSVYMGSPDDSFKTARLVVHPASGMRFL